jgi:hypothetical protein
MSTLLLAVAGVSVAFPTSALAYLDPGSSSLLLQLLLSGVAGSFIIVKLYWRRLKSWFSGSAETPTPQTSSEDK